MYDTRSVTLRSGCNDATLLTNKGVQFTLNLFDTKPGGGLLALRQRTAEHRCALRAARWEADGKRDSV